MSWPWPAPTDDGGADHLRGGTTLPSVALAATGGDTNDLSGEAGWCVIVIYPWTGAPGVANPPGWDDIPGAHGSTGQLEGYAAAHDRFLELGCAVFGLSNQKTDEQLAFSRRLALPFSLLSDTAASFAGPLRLPTFATGQRLFLSRVTLICCDGGIVAVRYPVHPPPDDASETLKQLTSLIGA